MVYSKIFGRKEPQYCLKCSAELDPILKERAKVDTTHPCLCGYNVQLTDPDEYRRKFYEDRKNASKELRSNRSDLPDSNEKNKLVNRPVKQWQNYAIVRFTRNIFSWRQKVHPEGGV